MVRACAKRLSGTAPAPNAYLCTITGHTRGTAVEGAAMDNKSAGRRGGWRLRAAASGTAAAVLLGGCSAGAADTAAEPGGRASGSSAPSASASGQASAEGAQSSATPSATPFEADADRVPRSRQQGATLAEAAAM